MSVKRIGTETFHLDPAKPPALSAGERMALLKRRDDAIDYSDLPSQAGMDWARPGAMLPADNKRQLTIRLDSDVLEFFRATGKRYQSRINAALREYMQAHKGAV